VKLTPKQEKFCQEYIKTGNASEAFRRAYPASLKWKPDAVHSRASILLSNSKVQQRIDGLRKAIEEEAIADAKERQRFWTEVMRDQGADMKHRLKASELLAKAQGDFVERREISGPDGKPIPARVVIEWHGDGE